MLRSLFGRLSGLRKSDRLKLTSEPQVIRKPSRLLSDGKPIRLMFDNQDLQLCPERGITPNFRSNGKAWILEAPNEKTTVLKGFTRIEPGENLLIGRESDALNGLFLFPQSVARRVVTIDNEDGEILASPLSGDGAIEVSLVEEAANDESALSGRLQNLRRMKEIFGGAIELLSPQNALMAVEGVLDILNDEAYRPKDEKGLPGGLLDLPDEPAPIILGDLHAQIDTLLKILCLDGHLAALENGDAYLLMLGDVVHREGDNELQEMDSSLLMLDLILRLKQRFPRSVFCLRGNHESFDEDVGKGGVPQGLILKERATALRGPAYADRLKDYFEALPYFARSKDFIACHAGAPTRKATPPKLINIRDHPKLARELMWNRSASPSRPGGYSKKDVKRLRAELGRPKKSPFLVSHTPRSREGTFWADICDIKGHHVLYSARPKRFALYTRIGSEMLALEYSGEPLLDYINQLD